MSQFLGTRDSACPSLCADCLKFFDTSSFANAVSNSDEYGDVSVNLVVKIDRVTGSGTGCEICRVILSMADEFENDAPEINMEFIFGSDPSDDEDFPTGYMKRLCSYAVYAAPDDPAAQFVKNRPVEIAIKSPNSIDTAKSWISQCCADHKDCSELAEPVMPTRCLSVKDLNKIHICDTRSRIGSYMALSYCWGPKQYQNLTATTASFGEMLDNIPFSTFPLTLQDAIYVAHELGYLYLWIDALCIIQDDDDDKNYEISQMRRIFSNAHCTIIAATAAHCHAGFLHDRKPPPFPEFRVPYPGSGVENGHMFLKEHDPDRWSLYDPLEDPINERAWTLEERLLSPRRLIYSKNHLRWLCETSELTNGGDVGDRKQPSGTKNAQIERLPRSLSPKSLNTTINEDVTLQQQQQGDNIWSSWLSIVEEYNLRCLTKSDDKLRAIGGIASLYQLKTNDRYCAGLWWSHLTQELLWSVGNPRATYISMISESPDPLNISTPSRYLYPRPKYRAPTWSWASVDGAAGNFWGSSRARFIADAFEIIDCIVRPKKPNTELTAVQSAVLTVRGRMKKGLLQIASRKLYKCEDAWEKEIDFGICNLDTLEHAEFPDSRYVYCLEIRSRIQDHAGNQQGLALVEATVEDTFHRIGTFGTNSLDENWFEDAIPRVINII